MVYEKPEMEMILLDDVDIVTASCSGVGGDNDNIDVVDCLFTND